MLSICVRHPTKPINKQDLHDKSYYVRKQCCQNNPWWNLFWLHCTRPPSPPHLSTGWWIFLTLNVMSNFFFFIQDLDVVNSSSDKVLCAGLSKLTGHEKDLKSEFVVSWSSVKDLCTDHDERHAIHPHHLHINPHKAHWVSPPWLLQHMMVGDDGGWEQCRHHQIHTHITHTPPSSLRSLANSHNSNFRVFLVCSYFLFGKAITVN